MRICIVLPCIAIFFKLARRFNLIYVNYNISVIGAREIEVKEKWWGGGVFCLFFFAHTPYNIYGQDDA